MAKDEVKPSADESVHTENKCLEEIVRLRFRAVKLVMAEGSERDKADPFTQAEKIVNFCLGR